MKGKGVVVNNAELPILILPTAVVRMKQKPRLAKSVSGQVVVEEGYNAVRPLANIHSLINEVVDLLLRNTMTSFPMQLASQKNNLLGVGWPRNRRQRSHKFP